MLIQRPLNHKLTIDIAVLDLGRQILKRYFGAIFHLSHWNVRRSFCRTDINKMDTLNWQSSLTLKTSTPKKWRTKYSKCKRLGVQRTSTMEIVGAQWMINMTFKRYYENEIVRDHTNHLEFKQWSSALHWDKKSQPVIHGIQSIARIVKLFPGKLLRSEVLECNVKAKFWIWTIHKAGI